MTWLSFFESPFWVALNTISTIWWIINVIVATTAAVFSFARGLPTFLAILAGPCVFLAMTASTYCGLKAYDRFFIKKPCLVPVEYPFTVYKGIGDGLPVIAVSFRNDGMVSATNVMANIEYSRNKSEFVVAYGLWTNRPFPTLIERGGTKSVIVAVKDGNKFFAVSDMTPATYGMDSRAIQSGELTGGDWNITVILSADDFRHAYHFVLSIAEDGRVRMWRIKSSH